MSDPDDREIADAAPEGDAPDAAIPDPGDEDRSDPLNAAVRESLAGHPPDEPASKWDKVKAWGRWGLLVLGVVVVVILVRDAGPDQVWRTLVSAGVFLPLVMLCEIGFIGMDVISLRLMFKERGERVPKRVWLRSAMMAYGIMILLPAGRAGGEVMRAAALAPYIGGARAAAGATFLQGVTLWGNSLITIPCYVAVAMASGAGSSLGWLVLGNGVLTALVGSALLFGARFSKVGGWLGKRIAALSSHGEDFDASLREMPTLPLGPIGAAFVGRVFQTVQYAVILLAVGGSLTVGSALVAQAIHLVGAGLGDMVPNQVGITEGAYRIFASHLGLSDAVAQAISIALIHRICQFFLAGTSLSVGALWRPDVEPDRDSASPSEAAARG